MTAAEPRFLLIGQVTRPHGVRGEVRVVVHTDLPERFTWLKTVYVGRWQPRPVAVEGARFHQGLVLLKLAGYDDRTAADALRGEWLQVPADEAIPLADGEYFLYQVVGLQVVSPSGEALGRVTDVLETGANDVFVVQGEQGEWLLPAVDEVITAMDFNAGIITIRPMPGLLPG